VKGIIVHVEEEYGYRYWKWNTGKSTQEFIDWWLNLETVSSFFFQPENTLPFGKVKEISMDEFYGYERKCYVHLHTDGDSRLEANGQSHYHKGYDPDYFDRGKMVTFTVTVNQER
jgi:hypothetical protein